MHHQNVRRAESAIDPFALAHGGYELIEPRPNAVIYHGEALVLPAFAGLEELDYVAINDRRLDSGERREHPHDRAGARVCVRWQQARKALGYVKHDRARLKEREIAFLISRDLAERIACEMCALLKLLPRDQAHVVRLADLLQRPAHAHVAS